LLSSRFTHSSLIFKSTTNRKHNSKQTPSLKQVWLQRRFSLVSEDSTACASSKPETPLRLIRPVDQGFLMWVATPQGTHTSLLSFCVGRATKTESSGGAAYLNLQRCYSNAAPGRIKFPIQEQHQWHLAALQKSDISSVLGNPAFLHEMSLFFCSRAFKT